MPNEGAVILTYRELAHRLGISVTAARSRVRRAKVKGKWRVIPRNHPNAKTRIELPSGDLSVLAPDRRRASIDDKPQVEVADNGVSLQAATVQTLIEVYHYIAGLNTQLHAFVTENAELKQRLDTSESARERLTWRVFQLEQSTRDLDAKIAASALEKLENVCEITRLSAICEERAVYVGKLEKGAQFLQAKLRQAKKPLWKKIMRIDVR